MHRYTPNLMVIDPRGVAARTVAYHRLSDQQVPQSRITQHTHDIIGRISGSRDPRLFAQSERDTLTPANHCVLSSLSGVAVWSINVDAGWRLSLTGAAGHPLEYWDQQRNHHRTTYDSLLRPVFCFEQAEGHKERRVDCYLYAQEDEVESVTHNRRGQLVRHDDRAGTQQFIGYSLFKTPLEQVRRFLDDLEMLDWPLNENDRDTRLETQSHVTRTRYNAAGELIRQIDPLGNEQFRHQNLAGELSVAGIKLTGSDKETALVSDIRYDAFGHIERQTVGCGVITRAIHDPVDGRLSALLSQLTNAQPLQHLVYAYDPVGNPLSVTDASQTIRYFRNQRIAAVNTYKYDTLYQLIEAHGRQRVNASSGPPLPGFVSPPDSSQLENYMQVFEYDSGGNLHTLHHRAASGNRTESTVIAALSNRSVPWGLVGNKRPEAGAIDSGYDANGNLKELQRGQTLHWDARNQLRQVDQVVREDGPNDTERYVYDSSGQRLRKVRTACAGDLIRTDETRYLPGVEVRTSTEETLHVISVQAGHCAVQILHWEKGRPMGVVQNQQRYNLTDHLGSCTLELDNDAGLISQEFYYPYGGTAWWAGRDRIEASYKTIRYSGQERDATGLYYYGFRYYIPWRQRWLSADPEGVEDGLNLYRMVGSNPVSYVDDSGLKRKRFRAANAAVIRSAAKGIVKGVMKKIGAIVLVTYLPNYALTVSGAAIAAMGTGFFAMALGQMMWPEYSSRAARLRNVAASLAAMTVLANHFSDGEHNALAVNILTIVISGVAGSLFGQLIKQVGPSNEVKNSQGAMMTDLAAKKGIGQVLDTLSPYMPKTLKKLTSALKSAAAKGVSSTAREVSGVTTVEGKGLTVELDPGKFIKPVTLGITLKLLPIVDWMERLVPSIAGTSSSVTSFIFSSGFALGKKMLKTTLGRQVNKLWKAWGG